jgi:hypothetical protein
MRGNFLFGVPPISSAFAPYPLFQWHLQNKEISLNVGMKCWNSAFNALGLRVIVIVVQVGAVKNICGSSSAGAQPGAEPSGCCPARAVH